MMTVPVLMYHHINPNKGDMVTVTPEVFEAQMRYIRDSGFKTLTLDEVMDVIEGRLKLKEKCLALTFDDGYLDNYIYAFPVLKKYGIKAAVFIVSNWVEGVTGRDKAELIEDFKKNPPRHDQTKALAGMGDLNKVSMDWQMAREMQDSGLVEFHSHTATHASCDRLSKEGLAAELKGSRSAIEIRLKKPCRYLCWPKGRFSPDSVAMAKEAGYSGLFTTVHGVVKEGSDPFGINRIVVKDGAGWLRMRLVIYTNSFLSGLYMKVSGKR